jgi:hypothetical protein
MTVLFPAPDAPTSAATVPAGMESDRPRRTGTSGRDAYVNVTSRKATSPRTADSASAAGSDVGTHGSRSSSAYTRSTAPTAAMLLPKTPASDAIAPPMRTAYRRKDVSWPAVRSPSRTSVPP